MRPLSRVRRLAHALPLAARDLAAGVLGAGIVLVQVGGLVVIGGAVCGVRRLVDAWRAT